MKAGHIKELQSSEIVRKRLAKVIAMRCFRNTTLEEFHAGQFPSSEVGDYSDVQVVSPFGTIPWNSLSRLSDAEIKILMADVVDHCSQFLADLFTGHRGGELIEQLKERDPVPELD